VCFLLGKSPASELYLAYKIQTPGNYPQENIQHTEHGKSLKLEFYTVPTRRIYVLYEPKKELRTLKLQKVIGFCNGDNVEIEFIYINWCILVFKVLRYYIHTELVLLVITIF
jgi:hypothetical protein